jgi:hypothetical protein
VNQLGLVAVDPVAVKDAELPSTSLMATDCDAGFEPLTTAVKMIPAGVAVGGH